MNDESKVLKKQNRQPCDLQDCRFTDVPGSTFMFGKGRGFGDSRAAWEFFS
jgi:hypothetical protein